MSGLFQSCMESSSSDSIFSGRMVFSDEFFFPVLGFANNQSIRIWGTINPSNIQPHNQHSERQTVLFVKSDDGAVCPNFYKNQSVRGVHYYLILESWVCSETKQFLQNLVSRTKQLLLIFYMGLVLYWVERLRIHGLKYMAKDVGHWDFPIYRPCTFCSGN